MLFLLPDLKLYSETLSKHRQQENSGAKLFFFSFTSMPRKTSSGSPPLSSWWLAGFVIWCFLTYSVIFYFCCCCLVPMLCPTPCDPMEGSMSGSSVHHYLLELLGFMSIESVLLSNHFILCCHLLLLPSIFSSIRVFSNELALCIRWPK